VRANFPHEAAISVAFISLHSLFGGHIGSEQSIAFLFVGLRRGNNPNVALLWSLEMEKIKMLPYILTTLFPTMQRH
jgi:hypothetical protein